MKKIYLAGSIEFNDDHISWREKIVKSLKGYDYDIIAPIEQVCIYNKGTELYEKFVYENYIIPDITDVMTCDHFFIKLDKGVLKGAGSYAELTLASYLKKNLIYMLDGIEKIDLPGWCNGCLYNSKQVMSIDAAIEILKMKGQKI